MRISMLKIGVRSMVVSLIGSGRSRLVVLPVSRRRSILLAQARQCMTRRLGIAAGLLIGSLACVSPAIADTDIGTASGRPLICTQGVWIDVGYVVPAGGGVITSFSFGLDSSTADEQLDFEVLRPNGDGTYNVVGNTGLQTLSSGTGVETFPANIPVSGGEVLGFWTGTEQTFCGRDAAGDTVLGIPASSDPPVGYTVGSGFGINPNLSLNESAHLRTLPTDKAQCENGGWQNFGTTFTNQGDCVSFVATGGKNPPSGS